jgi:MFS family permease
MQNAVEYPKFRWFVMFTAAFAWITFGVVTMIFAPLNSTIADEFQRPVGGMMARFMALNSIGIGLGALFSGWLVDKFGPRKVLLGSMVLVTAYLMSVPHFSQTIRELVFLRFCEGFVAGPIHSTLAKLGQRWFPKNEQGFFNGVTNASIAVGFTAVYLLFTPWGEYFEGDWRKMIQSISVLTLISIVLITITLMKKEPPMPKWAAAGSSDPTADFKKALRIPTFWVGAFLLMCAMTFMSTINGLTPTFVLRPKPLGLEKPALITYLSIIKIGMVVMGFGMGFYLNKVFKGNIKRLALVGYSVCAALALFFALPYMWSAIPIMCVFLFLIGFFMNCEYPAVTVFIAHNYPPPILGRLFAICSCCAVFGSAILSGFAGLLLDWTGTFKSVYLLCMGLALAAAIATTKLNPIKEFQTAPVPKPSPEAEHALAH